MRLMVAVERISPTGGRELSTLQLSRELARRGHDVDLFFEHDGALHDEYRLFCRSMTHANMVFWRDRRLYHLARMAPSVLRGVARRPDVVYVQRFGDIAFGTLVGRIVGAPLVCHLRGFRKYSSVAELGRLTDRFISVSEATRTLWAEAGLDASRIDVVYNGIVAEDYPVGGSEELARARAELGIDPGAFVVLFCGRLDAEKGLEVLLDAWGRLGLTPAEGRLVILGLPVLHPDPQAYLRQLQELARPGCLWLPMRRDVVDVMHAADVLVLPSYAEGFGRALIEAMATGRPAVGSRVEGIPEILAGDFARFLFEPGDAGGLADLLAGLVGWRAREPGLAAQCTQYVRERFNLGRTADGVEGVLTEVLSGSGRRRRRRSGPGGDARRSG